MSDLVDKLQGYYSGDTISASNTGCAQDGICSGRVAAAGWSLNCSTGTAPFELKSAISENSTYDASSDPAAMNGTYAFMSRFIWSPGMPSNLSLNVQYKNQAPCAGDLLVRNCSLRAAIVLSSHRWQ